MSRRRILITGGTDGIGLALAHRFSERHDVMVTGRREPSDLDDVLPQDVLYAMADQREPDKAAQAIAQALLKAGWTKLDNVILNAATGYALSAMEETAAHIRETLDVNLLAAILQARTLHPWLKKAGGTLTIVGSVAHKGMPGFASYAASKAGLHGFARALREEWRGEVKVQVLHPGPTATAMHEEAGNGPGRFSRAFMKTDDVVAMLDCAIASGRARRTLDWRRLLAGGLHLGGRL